MAEPGKWPKYVPPLKGEQVAIRDDFMKYWLTILPKKYGIIETFNHGYAAKKGFFPGCRTLEIGAGLGEHLAYENLSEQDYTVNELREELAAEIRRKYPSVTALIGDCQKRIPAEDNAFDRILVIHVLEHLPDLPSALREIHRVLRPNGKLVVVLPCEGGLAYTLARRISAQRIFEQRYHQSYDWLIAIEHINRPDELFAELESLFSIEERTYYPLRIPSISLNLVIGVVLTKR